MANLKHLFKVNQKVVVLVDEYPSGHPLRMQKGTIKEVEDDHLIIHHEELDFDGWYEEGFNLGNVFPDYNVEV